METLITGNLGFIGSRLAKKIDAIGIDLKMGVDLINCHLPQVDIIYHLAAKTDNEESFHKPVDYLKDIAIMARLVKEYPNSKIIYAQSASSLDVQSPYGFSKLACGEYLKKFHKNFVICVFPNVYGGGRGVVDIFKDKNEVDIYGDGEQIRDFVHIDDIVNGLVLAKDWDCGVYFMGSGKGTKIIDLAKGKKINFKPARVEIRESILPNTTPNWKPIISLTDYLCQK